MKLQFLGGNRQVTGSRHLLEAGGLRVLVDCGMYQERDLLDRNWEPFPVPPRQLDAVVLTHAHLDHCGWLPRLVREGFRGPIYATPATVELAEIVLRDSAKIQEEDAAFKQKRHRKEGRRGPHPEVPLYTVDDVERALPRFQPTPYGEPLALAEGVEARFHDAGHILGSASVEFSVPNGEAPMRILFSGDLGQWDKPLLRDPESIERADHVVMESTYGDRDHEARQDVEEQLAKIVVETVAAGGNVVVPVFAIERAQEMMYHLSRLLEGGRIPPVPVFLDSPMAVEATAIFERHRECFDEETWELIRSGRQPLRFPGLKLVRSVEESKEINDHRGPSIIMAPSGMCNAGRIKHHLVHNLGRTESTILFTGYQARGTLGRQLLEGSREVRIHGRPWLVRARVAELHGFSGHADRGGLLRWLGALQSPPRRLNLVHGEAEASLALAKRVRETLGWTVAVPEFGESVKLT
jgi:metallo-beta-lactamase family protein